MAWITVSTVKGEGKIGHNNRDYEGKKVPSNIDVSLSKNNVYIRQEKIEAVYEKLFGEAIREYDAKQTRADRKYGSAEKYLEKVARSKQQEPFYEIILQFGDMFSHGIATGKEAEAKNMLIKAFADLEAKYPNLYFFNVSLHMDEATPHIHADYVPFADGYKKGLSRRVAMSKSLEQMGFKANEQFKTPLERWQKDTRDVMGGVAREYGYQVLETPNGKTVHKTVEAYKREVNALDNKAKALGSLKLVKLYPAFRNGNVLVNEKDLEKVEEAAKISQQERAILQECEKLLRFLRAEAAEFISIKTGLKRIKDKAIRIVNGSAYNELIAKLDALKKENALLRQEVEKKKDYISLDQHEAVKRKVYEFGWKDGREDLLKEINRKRNLNRGLER